MTVSHVILPYYMCTIALPQFLNRVEQIWQKWIWMMESVSPPSLLLPLCSLTPKEKIILFIRLVIENHNMKKFVLREGNALQYLQKRFLLCMNGYHYYSKHYYFIIHILELLNS